MLSLLAKEFKKVGSYSTLNTARSVISLISRNEIGNHTLIKRFCKGVSFLKPAKPKYDYIWDPAPVISKLGNLYPHETLSLEVVTRKLVLLLALGSGQQCQTIATLRLSQISMGERLLIKVPDHLKTSSVGRYQPLLYFARFVERNNLCIVRLLEHYLERTKNLRPSDSNFLFISWAKPHKNVGVQTINRWIKKSLAECGIDESYSAHSTRHASTLLAAKRECRQI